MRELHGDPGNPPHTPPFQQTHPHPGSGYLEAEEAPRFTGDQPRGLGGAWRRAGLALTEYIHQQTPEAGRAGPGGLRERQTRLMAERRQGRPGGSGGDESAVANLCTTSGARQRPLEWRRVGSDRTATHTQWPREAGGLAGWPRRLLQGAWEETRQGAGDGEDTHVT